MVGRSTVCDGIASRLLFGSPVTPIWFYVLCGPHPTPRHHHHNHHHYHRLVERRLPQMVEQLVDVPTVLIAEQIVGIPAPQRGGNWSLQGPLPG